MARLEQAASSIIVSDELPVCAHGDTLLLILQIPDFCTANLLLFQQVGFVHTVTLGVLQTKCKIHVFRPRHEGGQNLGTTDSLLRY